MTFRTTDEPLGGNIAVGDTVWVVGDNGTKTHRGVVQALVDWPGDENGDGEEHLARISCDRMTTILINVKQLQRVK